MRCARYTQHNSAGANCGDAYSQEGECTRLPRAQADGAPAAHRDREQRYKDMHAAQERLGEGGRDLGDAPNGEKVSNEADACELGSRTA